MTARKTLIVPGTGHVTLTDADHLATGGEGSVFVQNGCAFKLFLDTRKNRLDEVAEKIGLLSAIRHPFIVAPLGIVTDLRHNVVGYYMPFAKGVPLVKTFANSWRTSSAFDDQKALQLVANMRDAIEAAHSFGAILADGNEMNYLADGVEPRLLDVDSWKIGRFEATALMPSIRDYAHPQFSSLSDWFAWGIVSFQVLTGIHPYKGTHPSFKRGDLEGRMRANASVFNPAVKLNSAVRDFAVIPHNLRAWYERVFEGGERDTPPLNFERTKQTSPSKYRAVTSALGTLRHERFETLPAPPRLITTNGIAYFEDGGALHAYDLEHRRLVQGVSDANISKILENHAALVRHGADLAYIEVATGVIKGHVITSGRATEIRPLACEADTLHMFDNRIFAVAPQATAGFVELALSRLGGRVLLSVKAAWPMLARSTRFFEGFGVMDALGQPFILLPEGDGVQLSPAPALAEFRAVTGYARGPEAVMLRGISKQDGLFYQVHLRLNGAAYETVSVQVVDDTDLNVVITQKGVVVEVCEDGKVTAMTTRGTGARDFEDSRISREMRLFLLGQDVCYSRGQEIYRLSLT